MNIALADVQSMNPSAGGLVTEAGSINGESGDGQFLDMLSRQLNQHVKLPPQVEYPQVIDLEELLSGDVLHGETPGSALDVVEIPSEGLKQLIPDPAMETVTPEAVPSTVLKPVEVLVEETVGNALPAGGNALPPESGSVSKPLQVMSTISSNDISSEHKQTVKSVPVGMRGIVNTDTEKRDSIKLSELRVTDPALSLRSTEPGLPLKTEFQSEMLNARAGELQGIQTNLTDIAELSKGQNRLQNPTAMLQPHTTQQNTAMLPTSLETLGVSNSRDTAALGSGVGERVHWMINQKLNTATIRLDPPMLGRLEVHIQVNDDVTNVTINTQHAQTRDLIDNASFRLRDYLQENGYQNVNVDVSHQQEQQQHASQQATGDSDHPDSENVSKQGTESNDENQLLQFVSSDSVVDYFA